MPKAAPKEKVEAPVADPRRKAMRVQVGTLLTGLKDVATVVRGGDIPILGNVLVENCGADFGHQLRLTGTNLDIRATRTMLAEGDAEAARDFRAFTTTLPAKLLIAVLSELDAEATLLIEYLDGRAVMTCGRSRFKLPTLQAIDFPQVPAFSADSRFEIQASVLADALAAVDHAISTETTRYYLNGVYLHPHELSLRLATTDGHRLCRLTIDGPEGSASFASVIIPKATVGLLEKLLTAHIKAAGDKVAEPVLIESDGVKTGRLRITIGDTEIVSKMIDGEFPDYDRVIPTGLPNSALIDRVAMTGAIRRVAALASEKSRTIKASFTTDKLTLTMNSPENGEASEEMPISYTGAAASIGFNSKYWLEALAAIGSDEIVMAFGAPKDPVKLTSFQDGDGFVQILMPMAI